MIKCFMDTEFSGLRQGTKLISLGCITDKRKTFYAEFTDYGTEGIDSWIQENVIDNLYLKDAFRQTEYSTEVLGNKEFIKEHFMKWLVDFDDEIQFISDVSSYDFVLLVDLLAKTALDLPEFISPYCHDINQDIALCLEVSDKEAFDCNREELVWLDLKKEINSGVKLLKHNSLFDARVIQMIYNRTCPNKEN